MKLWKFTDDFGQCAIMSGSIMVRSLAYYRALEDITQDNQSGDAFEGLSREEISNFSSEEASTAMLDALEDKGILFADRSQRGHLRLNARFDELDAHQHIFCTSCDDIETAAKSFDYNHVIELTDAPGFLEALQRESYSERTGAPFSSLFSSAKMDRVNYGRKVVTIGSGEKANLGPFSKPKSYEDQNEFRFALTAVSPFLHDEVFLKLERPGRFFRVVDHPGGSRRSRKSDRIGWYAAQEIADRLKSVLEDVLSIEAKTKQAAAIFHKQSSEVWERAVAEGGREYAKNDSEVTRMKLEKIGAAQEIERDGHARLQSLFGLEFRRLRWAARRHFGLWMLGHQVDTVRSETVQTLAHALGLAEAPHFVPPGVTVERSVDWPS